MRREVPHGVHIGPHDAEVEPLGVHVVDLPELAAVDVFLHPLNGGVEQEDVTGHESKVAGRREGDELLALCARRRKGLLDQDMLA